MDARYAAAQPEPEVLVLACGALARELQALKAANGWEQVRIRCLPASLHNRPERIAGAVRAALATVDTERTRVLVGYADCGTAGALDALLAERGIERLPGAHCYETFAGTAVFSALADAEPGTFYLTDFLVRQFDRLVWKGLGLDRHPDLKPMLFGHYRRVVYLAQTQDPALRAEARSAAARLDLPLEIHVTGYGQLAAAMEQVVTLPTTRRQAHRTAAAMDVDPCRH